MVLLHSGYSNLLENTWNLEYGKKFSIFNNSSYYKEYAHGDESRLKDPPSDKKITGSSSSTSTENEDLSQNCLENSEVTCSQDMGDNGGIAVIRARDFYCCHCIERHRKIVYSSLDWAYCHDLFSWQKLSTGSIGILLSTRTMQTMHFKFQFNL